MEQAKANSQPVRDSFNSVPTAVSALCAVVSGVRRGLVATSLSVGVSYEPPMVAFSVLNSSQTWPHLRTAQRIGVSVLGDSQAKACRQIASKHGDRFAGLDITTSSEGAMFLGGAISWMDCSIVNIADAGDHELVLLQVHRVSSFDGEPLLFHRTDFRRLETLAASNDVVVRG
ncbi:flavin reductase family protein [Gordonia sp. DT219]|uniref:flavin reductase family protein n=1 Tax=Gordonia sp. DT219 TaxID=3416658 RepID=UPI003CF2BB21